MEFQGIGMNVTPRIALEYNYEKALVAFHSLDLRMN
jgi:hypothetical protein